jgi:hypothetical protein
MSAAFALSSALRSLAGFIDGGFIRFVTLANTARSLPVDAENEEKMPCGRALYQVQLRNVLTIWLWYHQSFSYSIAAGGTFAKVGFQNR